jgi:hypothetical protein
MHLVRREQENELMILDAKVELFAVDDQIILFSSGTAFEICLAFRSWAILTLEANRKPNKPQGHFNHMYINI